MKKVRIAIVFHIIVSCFLVISVCTALWAQEEKKRKLPEKLEEFEVKVGLLSSFAAYCTWPAGSTAESNDVPFTVGAFKEDEIITFLIEKIKIKKIGGKEAKIIIISDLEEIKDCDILFIAKTSKKKLAKILETVDGLPILTVSDTRNYLEKGVMINMFNISDEDNKPKVRFNANLTAARQSNLVLSARFLKYAIKVIRKRNEKD